MLLRLLRLQGLGVVLFLAACSSDPAAAPTVDAGTGIDHPVAVDTGARQDTGSVTDAGTPPCMTGSYVPCECSPGMLGVRHCVMGALDMSCQCGDGGMATDASAPADAGMDASSDGG